MRKGESYFQIVGESIVQTTYVRGNENFAYKCNVAEQSESYESVHTEQEFPQGNYQTHYIV